MVDNAGICVRFRVSPCVLTSSAVGCVRQPETRGDAVARTISMPSKDELPEGPRREFVTELRRFYRAAGRPPLRKVSQAIERHQDPAISDITASAETIRRMITGRVLPVERDRVRAVFIVFCELSGVDPEAPHWEDTDTRYPGWESNWRYVERLWDEALEEGAESPPPVPRPTPPPKPRVTPRNEDPWATSDSGYSDEPPF
jgi:hypothetical protein